MLLRIFPADESLRSTVFWRLTEIARGQEEESRQAVIDGIACLGGGAIPLLGQALDDERVAVRSMAVDVLILMWGCYGQPYAGIDARVRELLVKATEDPDTDIRRRASWGLDPGYADFGSCGGNARWGGGIF
jgi:hypothetical protein